VELYLEREFTSGGKVEDVMENRINRHRENLIAGVALEAAFLMRNRCANTHQGQSPKDRLNNRPNICSHPDPFRVSPCTTGESI
jgi:hypothetical protein